MGRITRRIDDDTAHKLEYGYDGLDRVQTMRKLDSTNTERFKWVFTYDYDGNVTKREDFVNGSSTPTRTHEYLYDDQNRLTYEFKPGPDAAYGYDGVGNLISLTDGGGTVTYTYDSINRQATVISPGLPVRNSAVAPIDFDYDDETANGGRKVTRPLPKRYRSR